MGGKKYTRPRRRVRARFRGIRPGLAKLMLGREAFADYKGGRSIGEGRSQASRYYREFPSYSISYRRCRRVHIHLWLSRLRRARFRSEFAG